MECGLKDCSKQQKVLITRYLELKMTNKSDADIQDLMVKSMLDMNTSKKLTMEKLQLKLIVFICILTVIQIFVFFFKGNLIF